VSEELAGIELFEDKLFLVGVTTALFIGEVETFLSFRMLLLLPGALLCIGFNC
jgi:hypothetical protein